MLQTWNRTCFRGGILEVSLQLPGTFDKPGMWPAVWLLGNLGRVGYGVPSDLGSEVGGSGNMWPYSYDTCLPHSYPYYMPPNTNQRYDACNASEILGYCDAQDYSTRDCEKLMAKKGLLQGSVLHGRGTPELDLLEVSVNNFANTSGGYEATISTSLQIAPLTGDNGWIAGSGTCYDQLATNLTVGVGGASAGNSQVNGYHGAYGAEVISALTELQAEPFQQQFIYRLEWKLRGGLTWYIKRPADAAFQLLFNIPQKALAGCGAFGSQYRTEDRPVPEEPMYLLLNLALANDFSPVPTHDEDFRAGFPYSMLVDYVRMYQLEDAPPADSQCDSEEWPTAAYINANAELYANPNISTLEITYNESLCNETGKVTVGSDDLVWHSYYDERCPVFGATRPGGCYSANTSQSCRQCYTKSTFEKVAFTKYGAYGDGTSGQQKTTGFIPNPICPQFVCKAKHFPASECADETLPSANTCTELHLSFNSGTLPVKYCGNLAMNQNRD